MSFFQIFFIRWSVAKNQFLYCELSSMEIKDRLDSDLSLFKQILSMKNIQWNLQSPFCPLKTFENHLMELFIIININRFK